jgi:apolipoprotein N-acyltransferase
MMVVNVCFYEICKAISARATSVVKENIKTIAYPLSLIAIIFLLVLAHGLYHQDRAGEHRGDFRISVVQGNIPQAVKWEAMARSQIIEIYSKLTELAAFDEPSLIIWPEAAFPGYFNRDFDAQTIQELIRKIEIPVLVGAPSWEEGDSPLRSQSSATAQQGKAYNSAFLVGPDGEVKQRYDKQNLVPFGEYVPMQWALGWLAPYAYSMGVSDFSAGHEQTVFNILNHEVSFSVLICFEDTFPELARQFVNGGAEFLAVITNDAWFGRSGAPAQHLQASIFRAIENGVPVVRAANTGISAFISNRGEVLDQIKDAKGESLFVTGHKTAALPVDVKPTLHNKAGWLFPYVASACFVIMAALSKAIRDKR